MGDEHNRKLAEAYRTLAHDMSALADILDSSSASAPGAAVPTAVKDITKKRKRTRDPNKPKAPLSAYLIFSNKKRESVKKTLGTNSNVRDVMRELASQWRDLKDAEKQPFLDIAQTERQKYEKAMEQYHETNGESEASKAAPPAAAAAATGNKDAAPVKTKDTPAAVTEASSSDSSSSDSEEDSDNTEEGSSSSDEDATPKEPVKPKSEPKKTAVTEKPKPKVSNENKAKSTKKDSGSDKAKQLKKPLGKNELPKKKIKTSA